MLGSNAKTHNDIKMIVQNILDVNADFTAEDTIASVEVTRNVLERLHQLAMFEINVEVLAKSEHEDAQQKKLFVVLNTVNKSIERGDLNSRESIMHRYGALLNLEYKNDKFVDSSIIELMLYLDPVDEQQNKSWWQRFCGMFKRKPKAVEVEQTTITDTGILTN